MPDDKTGPLKPIKWYKDLAAGKERLEAGAFLVEGTRAINQVTGSKPDEIIEILSTGNLSPAYSDYTVRVVTERQLHSISSTKTPQSTIAVVRLPLDIYSDHLPDYTGAKILLLEDIQDPGNVGTLIRSAVAFGFSGVILTEKCADPLSPKCIQSTAGTVLSLWIRRTSHYMELVEKLKLGGYFMVAADLRGEEDTTVLQQQDKLLLALGNEASGLSKSVLNAANYRLKIPIVQEKAESLNVAACGAICMYLSRK
ncbi:MAG: RNA methyltransferase [Chloroflexi bacterium]|nr:RNA methyltransferase [Chloroflexota bacterium]